MWNSRDRIHIDNDAPIPSYLKKIGTTETGTGPAECYSLCNSETLARDSI